MASPSFRFKHFEVYHDQCAMKVGTDGVLLGSWVDVQASRRVLDVGAGSGLIALIIAQRSKAQIVGVEINASAYQQASANFNRSPWSSRMLMKHADFKDAYFESFDLIVSNPPYFRQSLKAPVLDRCQARHDVELSYKDLISKVAFLLVEGGRFAVVMPFENASYFEALCCEQMLFLSRFCAVSTVQGHLPKRVLLEFSNVRGEIERTHLDLCTIDGNRSKAFSMLTAELYLDT